MSKGRFKHTPNLFATFVPKACSRIVTKCSLLQKIFQRILFSEPDVNPTLIHYRLDFATSINANPSLHVELKIAKSQNLI